MSMAVERRLPAIYDALDSGNNRAAIKLINSALQKHSTHQMLRVLKAVALQRNGKLGEGLQVCEEVRQEVPTDEQILVTMTIVYRKANQMQALAEAYAAASAASPKDGSLLRGVFANHVRSFNFSGQQQQAMKLHKLAGSNDDHYIWWSIVSLVLHAKAASQGVSATLPADKLLQLAEGLISKQIQRDSLQSYEQLMLYIHILQVQGKHKATLDAVKGDLGKLVTMADEKRSLQAGLHVTLGQFDKAAALFEEALQTNPDDWTSLQQYLDCMMPITAAPESAVKKCPAQARLQNTECLDELKNCKAALATSEATVQKLLQGLTSSPQTKADAAKGIIRGPQLAIVELQLRQLRLADAASSSQPASQQTEELNGHQDLAASGSEVTQTYNRSQALAEALLGYYQQLGHMLSCASDLRVYTKVIEGPSRHWLSSQLDAELQKQQHGSSQPGVGTEAMLQLRRQITAYQIQFDLQLPDDTGDAAEAHTVALLKLYKHSLTLCKGLDSKEKAPGDDLIPMAVATLMAAKNATETQVSLEGSDTAVEQHMGLQKRMLQALLVCEAAQKRSTVFAASRFACLALYGLLGAAGPAAANFDALSIKFIQHDTITGHHMLPVALSCLDGATADRLLADTIALHSDHQRDAGDTLMMAYDQGTYTKVLEFVDFKIRLEQSHTLAVAQTEQALLGVKRAVPQGYTSIQKALQGFRDTVNALPQSQSAQPSDIPELSRLRFNEDLSTRPIWLPPQEGYLAGNLLSWWEQQDADSNTGSAEYWWGRPGAAELANPAAQAFRQSSCTSLQLRWLMPRLAAQLLDNDAASAQHTDKTGIKSGSNLSLMQLSQLFGCPFTDLNDWLAQVTPSVVTAKQEQLDSEPGHDAHSRQQADPQHHAQNSRPQLDLQTGSQSQVQSDASLQTIPETATCQQTENGAQETQPTAKSSLLTGSGSQFAAHQLVSLAAFAAAAAGQNHWRNPQQPGSSASTPLQSSSNEFVGCLGTLQHLFSGICQTITAQLTTPPDHMLPGAALLAAAHLVGEPATWTSLFLTSWQHTFMKKKAGTKNKSDPSSNGVAALDSNHDVLAQQLVRLQQAYAAGLQLVLNAVNTCLKASTKAQVAHATQLALGNSGSQQSNLVQTITDSLPATDVRACLNTICENQKLLLKRIKLQMSELISAL